MAIKIDTNAVRITATQIADTNKKISNDFTFVEEAIVNLSRTWASTASDGAIRKFNKIKDTYCENRYNVVNDMVKFMNVQVSEGYEKTEAVVVSVASAFK